MTTQRVSGCRRCTSGTPGIGRAPPVKQLQVQVFDQALFHDAENHRRAGKEVFSVGQKESQSRRLLDDYQVEVLVCILSPIKIAQRSQVLIICDAPKVSIFVVKVDPLR
jgi:hypothetical protein